MSAETEATPDTGLVSLTPLVRISGIPADTDQLWHRFGGARLGSTEILRCAKDLAYLCFRG